MYVQRFPNCIRASARVGCIGTGFCDASVLHGPTTPYTMERVTLIVPWPKSMSPHFKPNISLCRNPVDAARRTSVRSRSARPAFRALTNEVDWVAVKQFISAGMMEQNRHQVADFGAAAFCEWQCAKPGLDLYRSNSTPASPYFCQ